MTTTNPIVIAYDGSDDARAAIDEAAVTLAGSDSIVLYVRQPLESVAAHLEGYDGVEDVLQIEEGGRHAAERLAVEGAEYARRRGLRAEPRVANSTESVAHAILAVADEVDAALIVLGSRGRRGLKSVLLGSVSHHVVQHARRPVLVTPAAALAAARRAAEQVASRTAGPLARVG